MTEPKRDRSLSAWTIYDKPTDYPLGYIARRSLLMSGRVIPTSDIITGPIEEMREAFLARGLICFKRAPSDHPSVVEVWM